MPRGVWTSANATRIPISWQPEMLQKLQGRKVQHQYVRAQLRDINMNKAESLMVETLAALAQSPQGHKCTMEHLMEGVTHMTERLQTADLAINFRAQTFFTTPNKWSSYMQMYEMAVATNNGLVQSTQVNRADRRVAADNDATFGKGMTDGNRFNFKGAFEGLGRVMSPGAPRRVVLPKEKFASYETTNPHFNPRSKQVFAALNYGRRPHGACTKYGLSYFVLKPHFKINALYFAGDTFSQESHSVSADDQVSFALLGAIYAKADMELRRDLEQSCLRDGTLGDSEEPHLLLEAHLFEPLFFSGNIETVYVCRDDQTSGGDTMDPMEWHNVITNARAFGEEHGAKVVGSM